MQFCIKLKSGFSENQNCSIEHRGPAALVSGAMENSKANSTLIQNIPMFIDLTKKQRIFRVMSERARELAILNKQLIEDEGHGNPMSISELSERMLSWLEAEYICYAIEEDKALISYSLWRDDGEFYYLRQLFTLPEHRLKGYAKNLLAYLEVEIFNDKPIRLEVLANNEIAKEFYRRAGYEIYCHTFTKPINKGYLRSV